MLRGSFAGQCSRIRTRGLLSSAKKSQFAPKFGATKVTYGKSARLTFQRSFNNHPIFENIAEELQDGGEEDGKKKKEKESKSDKFFSFLMKCLETAGITFSSIAILGVAGIAYHKFYASHVLSKMNEAFENGDPAAQLAMHKKTHAIAGDLPEDAFWVDRPQQKLLDDIISGKKVGSYYLVVGEKGTGKTSLILEAMKKVGGENVTVFDAHADPEIFRIRLGASLNFTFNEDYIGSLFSIRGPRDTTALLDIERAFSKLEELAMLRVAKIHRPLVMIINNAHLIKENEEGIKLLELLQQKAESLSGSGLLTIIFNSDDYWVYEKLKKLGTRLEVVNVRDFNRAETISALKFIRHRYFPLPKDQLTNEHCHQVYDLIGGRPQHITHVARHADIIKACHEIIDREKTWFLNQCGLLGSDMDDDVMEEGKFSVSAMLLMKEFVDMDRERMNTLITHKVKSGHVTTKNHADYRDHHLPELPLWRSRQIMTRSDYIQQYDNLNIFTIDSDSRVRADSVPMMRAFHEICSQPNFKQLLDDSIQRVADVEALERTREIVAKDLNLGSNYQLVKKAAKPLSQLASSVLVGEESKDEVVYEVGIVKSQKHVELHGEFGDGIDDDDDDIDDEDDEELYMEDVDRRATRKWWKRRMAGFDMTYLPANFNKTIIEEEKDGMPDIICPEVK
ncbi:hypothetical protein G9P44_003646 [Scheffersomyces stipitis]|nr:hypothetical protein G9P44_003646 [Scheffersomyces stipitis]